MFSSRMPRGFVRGFGLMVSIVFRLNRFIDNLKVVALFCIQGNGFYLWVLPLYRKCNLKVGTAINKSVPVSRIIDFITSKILRSQLEVQFPSSIHRFTSQTYTPHPLFMLQA